MFLALRESRKGHPQRYNLVNIVTNSHPTSNASAGGNGVKKTKGAKIYAEKWSASAREPKLFCRISFPLMGRHQSSLTTSCISR